MAQRGPSGRYIVTTIADEQVRSFVPDALPLDPPLEITNLLPALERAHLALGRLDGAVRHLPDPTLFIYSYVRKEAVLSSQIEGTQSSLSDLLRHELGGAPGVPAASDATEVSRYVAALDHAVERMRSPTGGLPLCNRLLREAHKILLTGTRGSEQQPGEFRRSQNWIGGTRPGNAVFVPPPPVQAAEAISCLERFLHADDRTPAVLLAGLAHAQFETIHPFLDGNGRIGRMLVTLILLDRGVLSEPVLYLSLFLKQHRNQYYDLLNRIRTHGDWEAWIEFFLEGVHTTAASAVDTAKRIESMAVRHRETIKSIGRAAGSALRVHHAFATCPLLNATACANRTGLSSPTVNNALKQLAELDVITEITGHRRNRIFVYTDYLAILNEGTEPA